MKTFAVALVAAASADKKAPPRHPLQRLARLNEFAVEWCNDNLTAKQAANWSGKFDNNVARFEARFERCGYYDENNLPLRGIKQITNGFRKWAERYLANDKDGKFCKKQPARQVARANAWFQALSNKYVANQQ